MMSDYKFQAQNIPKEKSKEAKFQKEIGKIIAQPAEQQLINIIKDQLVGVDRFVYVLKSQMAVMQQDLEKECSKKWLRQADMLFLKPTYDVEFNEKYGALFDEKDPSLYSQYKEVSSLIHNSSSAKEIIDSNSRLSAIVSEISSSFNDAITKYGDSKVDIWFDKYVNAPSTILLKGQIAFAVVSFGATAATGVATRLVAKKLVIRFAKKGVSEGVKKEVIGPLKVRMMAELAKEIKPKYIMKNLAKATPITLWFVSGDNDVKNSLSKSTLKQSIGKETGMEGLLANKEFMDQFSKYLHSNKQYSSIPIGELPDDIRKAVLKSDESKADTVWEVSKSFMFNYLIWTFALTRVTKYGGMAAGAAGRKVKEGTKAAAKTVKEKIKTFKDKRIELKNENNLAPVLNNQK